MIRNNKDWIRPLGVAFTLPSPITLPSPAYQCGQELLGASGPSQAPWAGKRPILWGQFRMTIEPNTSPCCHHDAGPARVEAMERELAWERTLLQHWQLPPGGGIDAHR